jgi:hypothetical protein
VRTPCKGAPLIATFAPEKPGNEKINTYIYCGRKIHFLLFKFLLGFDISLYFSLRIFTRPGIRNCISQVLINKSPTHTPRFYHFPFNFTAPSLSRVVKFLLRILSIMHRAAAYQGAGAPIIIIYLAYMCALCSASMRVIQSIRFFPAAAIIKPAAAISLHVPLYPLNKHSITLWRNKEKREAQKTLFVEITHT